jgi:predicted  nucleic acid-binding Zn-ribbon protein
MSLHGLPAEFDAFVERARAALNREITAAKNIIAAANAEKSSVQAALAEIQAQCKAAQTQLELTRSELQRLEGLVGVGHDIKKARTELKRVQSETEQTTKALEKLSKERTAREAQLVALGNEATRMLGIRAEAEAAMSKIRSQLGLVQQ